MKIEDRPIESLIPYARNPRRNDEAVAGVAASIKEFGFKQPIVVDANSVVVAGHTRVKAAQKLGLKFVPVVVADDLTPQQVKAFRILDNKVAEKAEWDSELLEVELAEAAIDLELFDVDFSDDVDAGPGDVGEDLEDIPPPAVSDGPAITKPGEIWRLGDHRVACLNNQDENAFSKTPFSLSFTSPPYGEAREYVGLDSSALNPQNLAESIFNYSAKIHCVNLGILRKSGAIYRYWDAYIAAAEEAGLKLLSWNVWDKMMAGSIGNQSAMFAIEHEWIFIFGAEAIELNRTVSKSEDSEKRLRHDRTDSKGRKVRQVRQADGSLRFSTRGENYEYKNLPTVTQISPEQSRKNTGDHPAVMPVALPSVYIEACTNGGDLVLDPFLGSGTTLIAAHRLGRICYGLEISPQYCDVICKRFYAETGIIPKKETGELFPIDDQPER